MKSVNAHQILDTNFHVLPLLGLAQAVIGNPAPNTAAMIYGMPGSQKSTFIIALCAYLQHLGPVCYKAIEEGVSLTFQNKLQRLGNVFGQNFVIQDKILGKKGEFNGFSFVVIDSATAAGVEATHILQMKNSYPNTMFIYIYQCTKDGKYRGSNEIEHEVDVVLKAENGKIIQVKNRCGGTKECSVQEMIDFAKAESKPISGFLGKLGKIEGETSSNNIIYIKKYVKIVTGEPVSRRKIMSFIADLKNAILAGKVAKTKEIKYIQHALYEAYKVFTPKVKMAKFEVDIATLKKMKSIISKNK